MLKWLRSEWIKIKHARARKRRLKAQAVLGITSAELFAIRLMRRVDKDDVLVKRGGVMVLDVPESEAS